MPVPAHPSPVRPALLRHTVHDRLRDAIVDGTLAPGEVLRDAELAAWLGVSRTPVREALLRLAAAGLVRTAPGRSTAVAEIDVAEVRDAQAVVAGMHRLAVAEAVGRMSEADLGLMRDAQERFAAAVAAGDTDAALAADDDFHAVPVATSGNRAIAAVLDQFNPVVRRLERLRFASEAATESVALHQRLLDACERGDAAAASEVSFRTWQNLADLIPPDPEPDPDTDQQETP
ncbi:GntR family transcriptional regulator [Nocardioides zeicaulis]|uniref:GntR family transcriptional regulator n=1 Tax=Nocardioides zeicaulis TaxID=1776857 RepID=A0ABV6E5E7_9ACTN